VPTHFKRWVSRVILLVLLAFAYFVAYPEDCVAVFVPAKELLALSNAASPWLYGLVAVAILAWTATAIWGRRPGRAEN
jgi:hypothetical protein